jgi:hypothetical protein
MCLGIRHLVGAVSVGALIFCCSCEKHPVGEDPEVQQERVDEAKGGGDNAAASNEANVVEKVTPTPAQFFPENTPSP